MTSTPSIDVSSPNPLPSPRARRHRWPRIAAKAGEVAVILAAISALVFMTTQAMPGDVATIVLGVDATPERIAALREQLGLNEPLLTQYWNWLSGVLRGDLGASLITGEPVAEIIGVRVRNSLTLGLVAFIIMLPLSLVLGVAAAYFRDRAVDRGFLGASMILNATPEFVTGTLLISVFATNLSHLLPPVSLFPAADSPLLHPEAMILPVTTLVLGGSMYLSRLVRVTYIDVLASEYVELARLKGLSTGRILFRHALPNALAPAIPAAMLVAAFVVGGVVVVETLFAFPGMGSSVVDAAKNRDIPVLQALILIIATTYFLLNLLGDLAGKRTRKKVSR